MAGSDDATVSCVEGDGHAWSGPDLRGVVVDGKYKVLGVLGEGGFGVVYEAEQERPMRRRVALKVIKPGMDSKTVVARFGAERQALAVMDHPNIARVLDGGATEQGYPYFVMELVWGVPITEFCDTHTLGIRERVELFRGVCDAVQHAHSKGVIHRDIKPSNILVEYEGGKATVKVIDFGVAKAIDQRLSEQTIFTERGQLIGTPEYMSPEQAEMSGLDIDTRTDVYSLGVVLYELLTGVTPFDRQALRRAAFGEIQRIIREVDPPRASTRLSGLRESGAVAEVSRIAKRRHVREAELADVLRRDLDWVLLRCLEKDRERRYSTAEALREELERYLSDEPVEAGPPSAAYRLRKFAQRHRAGVVAGVVVFGVLLLGIAGTTLGLVWALEERNQSLRLLADMIEQNSEIVVVEGSDLNGAEYAWELRKRAGDTESLAALRNISVLAAHEEDPRGEGSWDLVGRAIERVREFDPMATPTDRYGFAVHHTIGSADLAWVIGDELCVRRTGWAEERGDVEEVRRLWLMRRDLALSASDSIQLGAPLQRAG